MPGYCFGSTGGAGGGGGGGASPGYGYATLSSSLEGQPSGCRAYRSKTMSGTTQGYTILAGARPRIDRRYSRPQPQTVKQARHRAETGPLSPRSTSSRNTPGKVSLEWPQSLKPLELDSKPSRSDRRRSTASRHEQSRPKKSTERHHFTRQKPESEKLEKKKRHRKLSSISVQSRATEPTIASPRSSMSTTSFVRKKPPKSGFITLFSCFGS